MGNWKRRLMSMTERIEKFEANSTKTGKASRTPTFINSRMSLLESYWKDYLKAYQEAQEEATDEELASDTYFVQDKFDEVEDSYLSARMWLLDHLPVDNTQGQSGANKSQPLETTIPMANSTLKLPKISVPTFSGLLLEWPSFHDTYVSLIHSNTTLSDVEKMHYLKSSITGDASKLLSHLHINSANYDCAWKIISNRYNNKRMLVNVYLESLILLPSMNSESCTELRRVLDNFTQYTHALENLTRPVSEWDDWLVYFLSGKLDITTRRDWETSLSTSTEVPTFNNLTSFLDSRLQALSVINGSKSATSSSKQNYRQQDRQVKKSTTSRSYQSSSSSSKPQCKGCAGNHLLLFCPEFRSKSVNERIEFLRAHNVCNNCLRPNHKASECFSKKRCQLCSQPHHTMIHPPTLGSSSKSAAIAANSQPTNSTSVHLSNNTIRGRSALLATVMVYVKAPNGRSIKVRALLDPGSESNFITESLASCLRLPRNKVNISVVGVGQCEAGVARAIASHDIISTVDPSCRLSINTLILPALTHLLPSKSITIRNWDHIVGIQLADPDFDKPAPIDLILGVAVYTEIILGEIRRDIEGTPIAQATLFGWILSGHVDEAPVDSSITTVTLLAATNDLESLLPKFWELEELPTATRLSPEEQQCEDFFKDTHRRNHDGRYIVKLPKKSEQLMTLGCSKNAGRTMLNRLENKFARDSDTFLEYSAFITEYLKLHHMEIVPEEEENKDETYYMPHHAILKPDSTTTKLRVVFNASQKTSTGVSLNDVLHIGPKLQSDVVCILLNWRFFPYAFTSDIEKMFRQILVDMTDADLQRILWRSVNSERIRSYRLLTVTYGTACAPYLACRVLKQLAEDYINKYPNAARVIRENFYVDDALFGAYDIHSACQLRDELRSLLQEGGFKLRKWMANDPQLLAGIPEEDLEKDNATKFLSDFQIKTLGIVWSPGTDTFSLRIKLSDISSSTISKRSILADISRIYDPLGYLSPVTIVGKIFMQNLWKLKVNWDDPLPIDVTEKWIEYKSTIPLLNEIKIDRWLGTTDSSMGIELHGFSDAALSAYGAVIYIRILHSFDEIQTTLLYAKTRVSPVNTVSIPRLELCGAALLARLMSYIQRNLNLSHIPVHLWTDSTTVLAWLREHPSKWKVFVANRVASVNEKQPNATWHHVPKDDNPADCISRGIPASQLKQFQLWWNGPQWLRSPSHFWPANAPAPSKSELEEETRCLHVKLESEPEMEILSRFSNFTRLLRVTAYCFRFYNSCRKNYQYHTQALTNDEITSALTTWIKLVQKRSFATEIECVANEENLPRSSCLKRHNPILDKQLLLRVGGRIKHAMLTYEEKFPIILPPRSHFTSLVIAYCHKITLHGGVQATLHRTRCKYWILNGRSLVSQYVRKCVTCCRFKAATSHQLMGDLPHHRPSKPFLHSGVDYAGPFSLVTVKGRGHKTVKAYVVVFVCFAIRAVHLELVMDLSTEAFIAALHRFVSRRGRCQDLYSDNARNFIGAEKELARHLHQLHNTDSLNLITHQGIEWHFIPPASPHFGGLWEAGVKSFKHHFRRVVGCHTLSIEEMLTLLAQIEACLNSRPLHALTDDPTDLSVLTPGHFLVGESLLPVPSPSTIEIPINRLNRWQLVQQMNEDFWKQWSKEYLHTLQLRNKWQNKRQNINVGNLVLIKEDNLPPQHWLLGRVTEVHPGNDGCVRVATVQHKNGFFKRAVAKLCLLPVDTI